MIFFISTCSVVRVRDLDAPGLQGPQPSTLVACVRDFRQDCLWWVMSEGGGERWMNVCQRV